MLAYIYLERKVATCLSKIDLDFVAWRSSTSNSTEDLDVKILQKRKPERSKKMIKDAIRQNFACHVL